MEAPIYNKEGKKSGSLHLPEGVFGVRWSDALMHQVVTAMQANARQRVAHTKGRGDVRGGGRKPWKQKGTGRARHGSIRSPIWRGGGVTHGPRSEKVYTRALPKKMRAKALFMALSKKFEEGEIIFVDSLPFAAPKTAAAKAMLVALGRAGFDRLEKRKNAALITTPNRSEIVAKSFRNIGNVAYMPVSDLNPVAALSSTYLIIENPEAAVAILSTRASGFKNSPRT
ncbi:50S ribosomal protein L4 [Candidatus Kaiserbacteria bacterium]|nr:50S ribosomal protein L4 [Candidatus Kaiserbacteria bacterium]